MPDGSHWALQNWQRVKPNYGGIAGDNELRISHFTGDAPQMWIKMDWSYTGMWEHLYGQYTFHGAPVVPVLTDARGAVLDGIGRNLSIESYDSDFSHSP